MARLEQIMITDVLVLDPDMSLRDAVERLGSEGISGAPVVSGGRLVGVVSTSDLVEFQGSNPAIESPASDDTRSLRDELEHRRWDDSDLSDDTSSYFVDFWGDGGSDVYQRLTGSDSPEWDLLARHTVGEVMTRKIIALSPGTSLRDAAKLMTERRVHRVLVTEAEELVGIITTMDLVRAIAEGRFDGPVDQD